MSNISPSIASQYVPITPSTPNLIFWIVIIALLPAVVLFGGTEFLLLALAAGLSMIVWARPEEAPGAGMLFLFAAGIILPYGARLDVLGPIWQMYYWAAGLLVITMAAILRLGLRRFWRIPRSAKAFALAAVAAALYGVVQGASASYSLRQLYGVLLLIAYFGISLHAGSLRVIVKRTKTLGVVCALCFLIYYIAVFRSYGIHKEMGFVGAQASLLAALVFIVGMEKKKIGLLIAAGVLLLVPILDLMRSDVLTFLFAVSAAAAVLLKSRKTRLMCLIVTILLSLPAIFPPAAQIAAEQVLTTFPSVGKTLPSAAEGAETLLERTVQLEYAAETVRSHPLLGIGLGGELQWTSPYTGHSEAAYVDNGWAYLLQKMGLLGVITFFWLLTNVVRSFSRSSVALSACMLGGIVVTQFSQPAFFHFTTAPFLGTYAGLLLARHRKFRHFEGRVPCAPAVVEG